MVTTITGSINSSDTSITIDSSTGWPAGTNGEFFVVINKGQSTEEKVRVDTRSGSTLTVTSSGRGVDGTTAASHAAGESIQVCATAFDLDEANKAVAELVKKATAAGQVPVVSGANEYTMVASGTSGRILVGNGTTVASVAVSGDATLAASGALTIANDAVTAAKIAADAVGSSEIAAGAVGAAELASDAVTTAKILDANVTTGKLADSAVTSAKIADGTIVAADIASDAVTTAKILDANVTAAKLAAAARPRWALTGWTYSAANGGGVFNRIYSNAASTVSASASGGVVMAEAGSVIGISIISTVARTSGSIDVYVYKNAGATALSVTLDGTHTSSHYATAAAGSITFAAGDVLNVVSSSNTFAPSSALLEAGIWCQVT